MAHIGVVLVGGKGSRLKEITKKKAKPLITINNKPFLDYLIYYISSYKFEKIYLICSYKYHEFFKAEQEIILVDIDINEIKKFKKIKKKIFSFFNNDSIDFINQFLKDAKKIKFLPKKNWLSFNEKCKETFKRKFNNSKSIDPYYFVKKLNDFSLPASDLFVDTGSCVAWIMQDFKCLKNQRIFHDLNFTAMGWALPASIGASTENKRRNILCIVGDGSLMNNLQEMSLIMSFSIHIF